MTSGATGATEPATLPADQVQKVQKVQKVQPTTPTHAGAHAGSKMKVLHPLHPTRRTGLSRPSQIGLEGATRIDAGSVIAPGGEPVGVRERSVIGHAQGSVSRG